MSAEQINFNDSGPKVSYNNFNSQHDHKTHIVKQDTSGNSNNRIMKHQNLGLRGCEGPLANHSMDEDLY